MDVNRNSDNLYPNISQIMDRPTAPPIYNPLPYNSIHQEPNRQQVPSGYSHFSNMPQQMPNSYNQAFCPPSPYSPVNDYHTSYPQHVSTFGQQTNVTDASSISYLNHTQNSPHLPQNSVQPSALAFSSHHIGFNAPPPYESLQPQYPLPMGYQQPSNTIYQPPYPEKIGANPIHSNNNNISPIRSTGLPNENGMVSDFAREPPSNVAFHPPLGSTFPDSNLNHQNLPLKTRTPLPPNLIDLYSIPGKVRIFFVQTEGHITSPREGVRLKVYKMPALSPTSPGMLPGCLSGRALDADYLIVADESCWRLGLKKGRNFCSKGAQSGEYAFHDNSTNPARCVIIQMPANVTNSEIQRFDVLLNSAASVMQEPTTTVAKIESGFESTYNSLTNSMNTFVRESTPEIHKQTRWLRKGASNILKVGGRLASQGAHFVTDPIMEKSISKNAGSEHLEIFAALEAYHKASEDNKITYLKA